MGPAQRPIQCVLGFLPGRKVADYSWLSVVEVKIELSNTFNLQGKILLHISTLPIYLVGVNIDTFTFKKKVKPIYLITKPLRLTRGSGQQI